MNNVSFTPGDHQYATVPAPAMSGHGGVGVGKVPLASHDLSIALRWKWLILACVTFTLLLGVLATLLATPQYTATTRLEISREGSQIVNVRDVEPETTAIDAEFYQTQYGLLASRSLAERVARELRLADNAEFFEMYGYSDLAESGTRGAQLASNRNERQRVATRILLLNLNINPIRLSRLVDVSYSSPDPDFSTQVANAWAAAFIESNLERRFEATSYARAFLEDRLQQLRGRLEESERQLVGYASNEAIINIPVGTGPEGSTQERSLTADTLATLNQQLTEATADRLSAQSRLRQAGGATGEALSNQAINLLRERRGEAAADYAQLLIQFEPEYPAAQALAAQIQDLDRSIAREESRISSTLRSSYDNAVEREQRLSASVEGLKQRFLDQRRRSIQYNIFQRDVDTNRQLYDGLLQRYKEIGVAGGVGSNNVSIVDAASVPERPSSPRPLLNIALSLVVGLLAGVGLALLREQMDETLADPADLEKRLGISVLGAIPNTRGADPREELIDPKSGLTEAYLSVQSSLSFASEHGIPNTLVVTSTQPAEGKSTTAYAIAHSIGRSGARTVLIDGDMRSPSVHESLGLPNDRGLSNYLSGTGELEQLLHKVDGLPMAIITAGPLPPNAAELLRGPRLPHLIAELRQRFDHVIIDSPPVMGLADAPLLASQTEGTVFVIQARSIKARVAHRALERLRQGHSKIIGAVLTKFDPRRASTGDGYDYGYGYGYGSVYGSDDSAKTTA